MSGYLALALAGIIKNNKLAVCFLCSTQDSRASNQLLSNLPKSF